MWGVLRQVLTKPRYFTLATLVTLTSVSVTLLSPNYSLIKTVFESGGTTLTGKLAFVFSLLGSISTNFTVLSAAYLVLVSVLLGVNIALLTYYIRRRQTGSVKNKMKVANAGGIISAVFGIGCMACGSIVLTSLFGIVGAGAIIATLPLHGLEFGLLGIVLLFISIRYIANRVQDPLVCPLVQDPRP